MPFVATHAAPVLVGDGDGLGLAVTVGLGDGDGDGDGPMAACPAHCTGVADAEHDGTLVTCT